MSNWALVVKSGPEDVSSANERVAGYRAALEEAALDHDAARIFRGELQNDKLSTVPHAIREMYNTFADDPDAQIDACQLLQSRHSGTSCHIAAKAAAAHQEPVGLSGLRAGAPGIQ